MKTIQCMDFGEKIRFLRLVKSLTQSDLATRAAISVPYMNQIEKGKPVDSIGDNIIKRIADALETSVEELKSSGKPDISGYTANQSANVPETGSEAVFETERRLWQSLEASLRDTIARQQETINFLMELVRSPRSSDTEKPENDKFETH